MPTMIPNPCCICGGKPFMRMHWFFRSPYFKCHCGRKASSGAHADHARHIWNDENATLKRALWFKPDPYAGHCVECGWQPELEDIVPLSDRSVWRYKCLCGRTATGQSLDDLRRNWRDANPKPYASSPPKGGSSTKPARSSEAERITILEQRLALMESRLNASSVGRQRY